MAYVTSIRPRITIFLRKLRWTSRAPPAAIHRVYRHVVVGLPAFDVKQPLGRTGPHDWLGLVPADHTGHPGYWWASTYLVAPLGNPLKSDDMTRFSSRRPVASSTLANRCSWPGTRRLGTRLPACK